MSILFAAGTDEGSDVLLWNDLELFLGSGLINWSWRAYRRAPAPVVFSLTFEGPCTDFLMHKRDEFGGLQPSTPVFLHSLLLNVLWSGDLVLCTVSSRIELVASLPWGKQLLVLGTEDGFASFFMSESLFFTFTGKEAGADEDRVIFWRRHVFWEMHRSKEEKEKKTKNKKEVTLGISLHCGQMN